MQTVARLALTLLLTAYLGSSTSIAADALSTGVTSENGVACNSFLFDVIVPLLRKNDPNGHKLIADSLKKGNCIDLKLGSPVIILGTDVKSSLSKNNYLIWHSNGKVYSVSDKKIANVLPILALPEVVARQDDPISLEPATLPTEKRSNVEEGRFVELAGYLVAAALISVALFVFWTNRYRLRRWLRSRKRRAGALNPRSSLHLTLSRPGEDAYTAQVERYQP